MPSGKYVDSQRTIRAALIANRLKQAPDSLAYERIVAFDGPLDWEPLAELGISRDVFGRVSGALGLDPKLVFCHPEILSWDSRTSLHYRGMSTLSLKAARDYAGAVETLERADGSRPVAPGRARKIAAAYNRFICAAIEATEGWTLEDGRRQVVANMGITIDGVMRNQVGEMAERLVREMLLEWLIDHGLLIEPPLGRAEIADTAHRRFALSGGIVMTFSSEPDISFFRSDRDVETLACIVEIKGGIDPAGALERYGAAKKSLEAALRHNPRCKNFFLSAVFTDELRARIEADRLIEKSYDIVELIEDRDARERFFEEIFVYTLRMKTPST